VIKAVILAGGKGTRLGPLAADVPKPLVPLLGTPVLEHQIASLRKCGITGIVLSVGHLGERIAERIGDGARLGVSVEYAWEHEPLGTAGPLAALVPVLGPDFLVLYGDVLCDMDFGRMVGYHRKHGGAVTLAAHPNDHPYDSDLLLVNGGGRVTGIVGKKQPRERAYPNLVNAGVAVLSARALSRLAPGRPADLEHDVVRPLIAAEQVWAYRTTEYLRDMGTPDRLRECEEDLRDGRIARLRRDRPQRAVFFDRDGTLNTYVGLLTEPEQVEVPASAAAGVRAANRAGFLSIVVTNQPVVARNLVTPQALDEIHDELQTQLGRHGAYIDALYYCPHHPDGGYPEENPDLKIRCDCRKPGTALIEYAIAEFGIERAESYLVGDSTVDVATGNAAGLRTVLLDTGMAGGDGKYPYAVPDLRAADVEAAVRLILAEQEALYGGPRPSGQRSTTTEGAMQ
jgi:histidinol-phosphate phosphatase family protein